MNSPDSRLTRILLHPVHGESIVVGGSIVTHDAVREAIRYGVRGIIVGGINDNDLRELLGYELGVAITGSEQILSLIHI